MMRQMRDATKPIMIVAALAFVGLMVFEWGADITGQSAGSLGDVGSVNGQKVSYEAYMQTYRALYDRTQATQEEPVGSQQNREIEDQAWEQIVNDMLVAQELRRRGITVTDEEIARIAPALPPPDFVASPIFQDAEGDFDISLYHNWLAQAPADDLLALEAYLRDLLPREMLYRQLRAGHFVSDSELWQRYRDSNERVQVRYLAFDPRTRYEDSEFTVLDEAIAAYYEAGQDEFRIPAEVEVVAVVLDKTPSAADTAAMEELARGFRDEIREGADFAEIARLESSDQGSAAQGGDLGTFSRGRMVEAFDSTVFAAPVGEVVGPVRSDFGFHVIEVTERWEEDSASARHVLVPFGLAEDTEIALFDLADSLEDLAEEMPLAEAATLAGINAAEVTLRSDFSFLSGAGQVTEGFDWAFEEAEVGDVSPVFETQQAFYALELVGRFPARVLPLDQARAAIRATLVSGMKLDRAEQDAQSVLERIHQGESLESLAEGAGLEFGETELFSRQESVATLGRWNAATGAAFGLGPGEVSGVVRTPTNVFLLEHTGYLPADSAVWLGQLDGQRDLAISIMQQTGLNEWLVALREAAEVVDRRAEVMRALEEQADQPQTQVPPIF